jgi:hypothetical protein
MTVDARFADARAANAAAAGREDVRCEELLAAALTAVDPCGALAAAARDPSLSATARARLATIDEDGFRISALLVARLRFERLLHGHPAVPDWLDRDAAGFTETFRQYHAAVPPTAFFPPDEAATFAAWLAATGASIPAG